MTTAPLYHPGVFDEAARSYLLAVQRGEKPVRPDCGQHENLIVYVENCLKDVSNRVGIAPRLLDSMIASGKYPGLAELLSMPEQGERRALALVEQSANGCPALPIEVQLDPELAAGACWWLDDYAAYSLSASPEGYKDFHEDCGLFVLAAVSARRVHVPVGQGGEYTPLSVALVAKPGTYAKSTTAEVAISLLRTARLHWLLGSDETTPQKLLMDMAGAHIPKPYATWDEEKKAQFRERKAMAAQVAWYCDEFGELVKSINKATGPMADLKKLILKFDNCPPSYSVSTVARGREEIAKPFLSFLGVMTPTSIRKNAKEASEEWGEGFWSRFVFSCAPDDDGIDAPFEGETPIPPALAAALREYHERLGEPEIDIRELRDKKEEQVIDYQIDQISPLPEITISHEPIRAYWTRYRSSLKKLLKQVPEDLKASYLRLPTRALRVAALFASFEGLKEIEFRHWAKAQEIAERWRKNLHEFYAQVNTTELSQTLTKSVEEKILACVEKLCAKQEPPNLRDLVRYIKGPSSGMLKSAVFDLVRVGLLSEQRMGKTIRYFPASPDDS